MLLLLLLSTAFAQTCGGYVAIDGALLEGEAACYFGTSKSAQNAYVRTDLLTAAMGLESAYLPETSTLRFENGTRTVDLAATGDVALALSKRNGTLSVGGQAQRGRSAILADSSYLPLAELVGAFGGSVVWNGAADLVVVDSSAPVPESGETEITPPERKRVRTKPPANLGAPRYGVHDTYTRVAVDIPAGVTYQLAVDGNNFIVLFSAARAEPYQVTPDSAELSSLGYAAVADGDALALIVNTDYAITASGRGFEVGQLGGPAGGQTLYVDFAPHLKGGRIPQLPELPEGEFAAVRHPTDIEKTVVIDPGHGGEDPGAIGFVTEKELTLSLGFMLKEKLRARGINVQMSRDDDTFIELEDRAGFAVPSKHNLFISLHANASETAGAQGIETWVFGEPQDDSLIDLAVLENGGGNLGRERTVRARKVAASIDGDLLREENLAYSTVLAQRVQRSLIGMTDSENRGVKKNYFVVIRDARVPALLVELGFVNHPREGRRLADKGYQERLAEALAKGVGGFLTQGESLASLQLPVE